MAKRTLKRVTLSTLDKAQLYDYFDNRKKRTKQARPVVLDYNGSVLGELHYWY